MRRNLSLCRRLSAAVPSAAVILAEPRFSAVEVRARPTLERSSAALDPDGAEQHSHASSDCYRSGAADSFTGAIILLLAGRLHADSHRVTVRGMTLDDTTKSFISALTAGRVSRSRARNPRNAQGRVPRRGLASGFRAIQRTMCSIRRVASIRRTLWRQLRRFARTARG